MSHYAHSQTRPVSNQLHQQCNVSDCPIFHIPRIVCNYSSPWPQPASSICHAHFPMESRADTTAETLFQSLSHSPGLSTPEQFHRKGPAMAHTSLPPLPCLLVRSCFVMAGLSQIAVSERAGESQSPSHGPPSIKRAGPGRHVHGRPRAHDAAFPVLCFYWFILFLVLTLSFSSLILLA